MLIWKKDTQQHIDIIVNFTDDKFVRFLFYHTIYDWGNNICIFQPGFTGKKYTTVLEGSFLLCRVKR